MPEFKSIVDKLIQAADQGMEPNYELIFPELKVRAATDAPTQELLIGISRLIGNAGLQYAKQDKFDDAIKAYNAQAIYGYRLWKNGVYRAYRYAGQAALSEGIAGLQLCYDKTNNAAKKTLAKELADKKTEVSKRWVRKEHITQRLNECLVGDLSNLALNDKDRTWRIQGVMWLGVAQWTSAGKNQRAAIQNFLTRQARSSTDPVYVQACKDALAITREDIQRFPVVM